MGDASNDTSDLTAERNRLLRVLYDERWRRQREELARLASEIDVAVAKGDQETAYRLYHERLPLASLQQTTEAQVEGLRAFLEDFEKQAKEDREFPRQLAAPDVAERKGFERLWREIKDNADLFWESYVDPEMALRRTRRWRKKAPIDPAELAAQAAGVRARSKELLLLVAQSFGANLTKAPRVGLLMRIDARSEGEPWVACDGVMGAYEDVISDEDLKPVLSRKRGPKTIGTKRRAAFVVKLLKEKCGITVSENTIDDDWKEAREMRKKQRD